MDRSARYRRPLAGLLVLLACAGAATVTFGGDRRRPVPDDCSDALALGRRSHDLGLWMNSANPGPAEIADRQAELAAAVRATADAVHTAALAPALTSWADALDMDTALQRRVGDIGIGPQWLDDSYRVASMTQDAVQAIDTACPGMRAAMRGE